MQILPKDLLSAAEAVLETSPLDIRETVSFSSQLNKAFQRINQEDHSDQSADLPALVAAPYNQAPQPYSPFVPQEVHLTVVEVEKLASLLEKDGVAPKIVQAIRDMGGYPGGPTLPQILNAASAALGEVKPLSKLEKTHLQNLLQKAALGADNNGQNQQILDVAQNRSAKDTSKNYSGEDKAGQDLQALFGNGQIKQALSALLLALEKNESPLTFSREEISALSKALNLSDNARAALDKVFAGQLDQTLSGGQWKELLTLAAQEVDRRSGQLDKLMGSLEKNAPSIIRDATLREEMARQALLGEDRSVANARILMKDTATQAMPWREDEIDASRQSRATAKRQENTLADKPEKSDPERSARVGTDGAESMRAMRTERQVVAGQAQAGGQDNNSGRDASQQFGQSASQQGNQQSNQQGNQQVGREVTRQSTHEAGGQFTATPSASSFDAAAAVGAAGLFAATGQGAGAINAQTLVPGQGQGLSQGLSSQTLNQIEQAVFTAHKNGVQRLEIALNPQDLGGMTVVLTSRNGEVTALIQPEKAETTNLIIQHADKIKAELENQGVRIEKVEVQTQLADQGKNNWQGMQQHNSSADFQERQRQLERLRLLNSLGDEQADVLAHDMQIIGQTARLAGSGLHLVA